MELFPHRRDDSRSRAARRGRTRREQRQRRPELEGLEVRALLSTITEYNKILTSKSESNGIASDGTYLWVAEQMSNQIAEIDPSTHAVIKQISVPLLPAAPAGATAQPYSIVVDKLGRVWFTEDGDGGIGMYDPKKPLDGVRSYPMPWTHASLYDPLVDAVWLTVANGYIWFTDYADNLVGSFNPANSPTSPPTPQVYLLPGATNSDQITSTPDGKIWFTESQALGMFDPTNPNAVITQIPLQIPAGMSGRGIAVDSNGDLWIGLESRAETGGAVVWVNHNATAQQRVYLDNASGANALGPSPFGVAYVAAGSDGYIWFSEASGNNSGVNIGMINPSSPGTPVLQSTNISYSQPAQLVKGPSGIVWFTDRRNDSVGVVTTGPLSTGPTTVTISAQLGSYNAHVNKKHRLIGKPSAQVTVTYSAAMNTATIDKAGIYTVEWASTRKVKKKLVTTYPSVNLASVTADPSATVVTLLTTAPRTEFAKGGRLVVTYPGATPGAAYVDLPVGSTTITIPAAG
jgi:YVTN family beta-propeller protein